MRDYFDHARAAGWDARVYFTPTSRMDTSNPWFGSGDFFLPSWPPPDADVLVLGGLDWSALPDPARSAWPVPVINLIQHVRHADPGDALAIHLAHRAIRICVSPEVEAAITATGRANGPVFCIPNGISADAFPAPVPYSGRHWDILIAGIKNPAAAHRLAVRLEAPKRRILTLSDPIPRRDFLSALASTRVAVFLPNFTEGFYLPALEGMAAGCRVVCPDCIGNRSFCLDSTNCFRPPYDEDAIATATERMLAIGETAGDALRAAAAEMVARHDITLEREAFLRILADAPRLWRERDLFLQ